MIAVVFMIDISYTETLNVSSIDHF